MLASGSGWPMTPVEAGSTRRSGIFSSSAARRVVSRASGHSFGPGAGVGVAGVHQDGLGRPRRRRSRVSSTGAAFTRLRV